MTTAPPERFIDPPNASAHEIIEIARTLLAAGPLPSRNSAFASYRDPVFQKGVRLARQLRDLARAIAEMRRRGAEPHIDVHDDGTRVHTVQETRAGPVTRVSHLPLGADALLWTLSAQPSLPVSR
jgi:hypothetical protein